MKLRLTLTLILCAASAHAADSPQIRAAKYFAEGLETPLLQIRGGAQLLAACQDRLRRACSREQRKSAAEPNVLTLLDALTLFPQRLDADPAASVAKAAELRQKIAATSESLLHAAADYDLAVFARYGAALRVCPEDGRAANQDALDSLIHVHVLRFQGVEMAKFDGVVAAMLRDEEAQVIRLRALPPEDCAATRVQGEYLMELMNAKLQPWMKEEPPADSTQPRFEFQGPAKPKPQRTPEQDRELVHAVAGNFVTVVATELQLTAFPDSEARIKAIADAVERAKAQP